MITAPNTQPSGEFIENKILTIQKCMDWLASVNHLEKESDKKVNIQFVGGALIAWESCKYQCPYLDDAEKWRGHALSSATTYLMGYEGKIIKRNPFDSLGVYLESCLSSLLEARQLHNNFTNAINNLSE